MEYQNNQPKPTSKRLFIGGLPYRFTEGQLLELFAPFGRIISLRIMHNQWGKSRGIGYVEFTELTDAIAAKQKLHNYRVSDDRTIIVDYAQPDPFKTPEGQQRHLDALKKKNKFHPEMIPVVHPDRDLTDTSGAKPQFETKKSFAPKKKTFGAHPEIPANRGNHLRQSVFLSRYHGSKVGAKFASKTRGKKTK